MTDTEVDQWLQQEEIRIQIVEQSGEWCINR